MFELCVIVWHLTCSWSVDFPLDSLLINNPNDILHLPCRGILSLLDISSCFHLKLPACSLITSTEPSHHLCSHNWPSASFLSHRAPSEKSFLPTSEEATCASSVGSVCTLWRGLVQRGSSSTAAASSVTTVGPRYDCRLTHLMWRMVNMNNALVCTGILL